VQCDLDSSNSKLKATINWSDRTEVSDVWRLCITNVTCRTNDYTYKKMTFELRDGGRLLHMIPPTPCLKKRTARIFQNSFTAQAGY